MDSELILVIEDDATMRRVLTDNLTFSAYRVATASEGGEALRLAEAQMPALVLLDIMLPGMDGYDVFRRLRKMQPELPVIMLTAKGQESDIVMGLNLGADDYVTKPFSLEVLLARVSACLRRHRRPQHQAVTFGDCRLDCTSCTLTRKGREVSLTPKEFGVLQYLTRQAGRALTRDNILEHVWGQDLIVTPRSVDRCITTLRSKIEPEPDRPRYIITIRDVGYRFEMPETSSS
jgi:DNA-binding response OmpR family regulator